MNKIRQQNGKNWREYQIGEETLTIITHVHGIERKATIPYDVGLISESYDETVMAEKVFFGKIVPVLIGIGVVAMFGSFPMLAEGEKNQAWVLPGLLMLGAAMAVLITTAIKSQPKTVGALRLYIGNGQFFLYGRNDQDRAEAKELISKLFEVQKAYFRKKYLTYNEAMSVDQIKGRLSWLYENRLIDQHALNQELRKIPKKAR